MGNSSKPVTMKDVARLSGVDVSVVSRVLSKDPRLVITPATRERVERAILELDYRPNRTARALRTAKSGLIAFVLPQVATPIYLRLVTGAALQCKELGYQLVVAGQDDPRAQLREYEAGGIDGILIAAGALDEESIAQWRSSTIPVVAVNRTTASHMGVCDVDYEAASILAGQYLNSLGHSSVALLTAPSLGSGEDPRTGAFIREMDIDPTSVTTVAADGWESAAGYRAGIELCSRLTDQTAIFVTTLQLAVGLLKALRENGRAVPDEISVLALHDEELAEFTTPPLTTVALPMETLGARAAIHLVAIIGGAPPSREIVDMPPQLVVRDSAASRKGRS